MISSSVIILLSSSATSPRSSFDPFEATENNNRLINIEKPKFVTMKHINKTHKKGSKLVGTSRWDYLNPDHPETCFSPSLRWLNTNKTSGSCHALTHHLLDAPHKNLSSSSFHLQRQDITGLLMLTVHSNIIQGSNSGCMWMYLVIICFSPIFDLEQVAITR